MGKLRMTSDQSESEFIRFFFSFKTFQNLSFSLKNSIDKRLFKTGHRIIDFSNKFKNGFILCHGNTKPNNEEMTSILTF